MKVKNTNNFSPDGCFFSDKFITKYSHKCSPSTYINMVHESEKYQEL